MIIFNRISYSSDKKQTLVIEPFALSVRFIYSVIHYEIDASKIKHIQKIDGSVVENGVPTMALCEVRYGENGVAIVTNTLDEVVSMVNNYLGGLK